MAAVSNAFTDLVGCRLPLQQAGMGGVATPELALAVTGAGALGMLGTPGGADALTATLDDVTGRADGPVGINFLMPFCDPAAVEVAAARLRLVEFFWGGPDPAMVARVHDGGALCAWQVGSADEASAAYDAGCDLVVAQGVEAGGHVRGTVGLLPLLDAVLERVTVPVVASGGIATGRGVAAVLAAGAAGARVGTAFVATTESGAHPDYIAALCAAGAGDTVLTEAFSVMWPDAPHRVLRSCIDAASSIEDAVVGTTDMGGSDVPLPRWAVVPPTRRTSGRIDAMALYAGQSVGSVDEVVPAAELVRRLWSEARRHLGTA